MDCRTIFVIPKKYEWGSVVNGTATGFFADIVADKIDFAVGAIFFNYARARVSRFTTVINEGNTLTIASPNPRPKRYVVYYRVTYNIYLCSIVSVNKFLNNCCIGWFRSLLTLFKPLDTIVWICLFVSIFTVAVFIVIVAKCEQRIVGKTYSRYNSIGQAVWFCYGSLMGEDITKARFNIRAWGIR